MTLAEVELPRFAPRCPAHQHAIYCYSGDGLLLVLRGGIPAQECRVPSAFSLVLCGLQEEESFPLLLWIACFPPAATTNNRRDLDNTHTHYPASCTYLPLLPCLLISLSTMPMILNSNRLHGQRRSSMTRSASCVSSTSRRSSGGASTSQQSMLADWFTVLTGNSSSVTLAMNPSTKSRQESVQSASSSLSSSGMSTPPRHSRSAKPKSTSSMEDSWGQFVDTAEAERELVRNSKVLSRKEAPRLSQGYHHTRRSIC